MWETQQLYCTTRIFYFYKIYPQKVFWGRQLRYFCFYSPKRGNPVRLCVGERFFSFAHINVQDSKIEKGMKSNLTFSAKCAIALALFLDKVSNFRRKLIQPTHSQTFHRIQVVQNDCDQNRTPSKRTTSLVHDTQYRFILKIRPNRSAIPWLDHVPVRIQTNKNKHTHTHNY